MLVNADIVEFKGVIALPEFGWKRATDFAYANRKTLTDTTVDGDIHFEEHVFKSVREKVAQLNVERHSSGQPLLPTLVMARVKRFYNQCQLANACELQRQQHVSIFDAPRLLPKLEYEERRKKIKARLEPGFMVEGPTDPSPNLIKVLVNMFDTGILTWVPPSKCIEFALAVRGGKTTKSLVASEGNRVIVQEDFVFDEFCSIDTIEDWMDAMERRSVAFEMANLLSFENVQFPLRHYKRMMRKKMLHHESPTIQRVLEADKDLFTLLADYTREGLQLMPDGTRPLDNVFKKAFNHPHFNTAFAHLPIAVNVNPVVPQQGAPQLPILSRSAAKRQRQQLAQQQALQNVGHLALQNMAQGGGQLALAALPPPPTNPYGLTSVKGGKAKCKGKKGQRPVAAAAVPATQLVPRMPQEFALAGGWLFATDEFQNRTVCYDFSATGLCFQCSLWAGLSSWPSSLRLPPRSPCLFAASVHDRLHSHRMSDHYYTSTPAGVSESTCCGPAAFFC